MARKYNVSTMKVQWKYSLQCKILHQPEYFEATQTESELNRPLGCMTNNSIALQKRSSNYKQISSTKTHLLIRIATHQCDVDTNNMSMIDLDSYVIHSHTH